MTQNKLGIIGGSGLYEIGGLENLKWKTVKTPWGNPSDQILSFKHKGKDVCFSQIRYYFDNRSLAAKGPFTYYVIFFWRFWG